MGIEHHAGNLSEPSIVSAETMVQAVMECGIVPFFANAVPGYSVEEMTHPSYWFDGDAGVLGPWDWKIDCVRTGDIFYGKFLCGGKASFATLKWYRELRNYRQSLPKYALEDGPQKAVMDYLQENGTITVKEVRGLLGIKKSAADALLTKLQMQCRVVIGDITRVYRGADLHYSGWQVASFCRPEDLIDLGPFGGGLTLETSHSPEESYSILTARITELSGESSPRLLAKILAC